VNALKLYFWPPRLPASEKEKKWKNRAVPRMFVKSEGGVGFERGGGGRRRGACRLLEKGPRVRVDSPVSLLASIGTYSVAS
jgi:hypothetical protein